MLEGRDMSRPYKQTRSLTRVVNAHCSAEGRARHHILRNLKVPGGPAVLTLAAHIIPEREFQLLTR